MLSSEDHYRQMYSVAVYSCVQLGAYISVCCGNVRLGPRTRVSDTERCITRAYVTPSAAAAAAPAKTKRGT